MHAPYSLIAATTSDGALEALSKIYRVPYATLAAYRDDLREREDGAVPHRNTVPTPNLDEPDF